MNKALTIFFSFCITLTSFAQDSVKVATRKHKNLLIILDSQRVQQSDLLKYKPDSITTFITLSDTSATKLYGDSAKDGAIIIETRSFARQRFISFFRKSSTLYDSLFTAIGNDTAFQYIINDKIQVGNYEGNLSSITDELFEGLEILTKEQLNAKYNIIDKQYGILVHSKKPKDLYDVDKKF
jgi:hypothetical protein